MKKVLFLLILLLNGITLAYQINIDTAQLRLQQVQVPGYKDYEYITLGKGAELITQPGEPSLPTIRVQLALPPGVEIDSVDVQYAEPEILTGYHKIIPQQKPYAMDEKRPDFIPPDKSVYSSLSPFPEKLFIGCSSGNASGYQLGNVSFAPVQYIPLTGQVFVYRTINFTVSYKASKNELVYPRYRIKWIDDEIRRGIEKNVINPGEIIGPPTQLLAKNDTKTEVYPYLIISPTNEYYGIPNIAEWKKKKGLNVYIATIDEIENNFNGNDLQEQIRNCIKYFYQNYATQYVLLSGGEDNLAGFYPPMRAARYDTLDIPTDTYFGCLDGNWDYDQDGIYGEWYDDSPDLYYDLFIGRIAGENDGDLAKEIDKILCYEGADASTEENPYDYQQKVLLAGGWLETYYNAGGNMIDLADNYFTAAFWDTCILQDVEYTGDYFDDDRFLYYLNLGPGIIAHFDHSGHSWLGTNPCSDPPRIPNNYYQISDIQIYNLENAPRYGGIFYANGCSSADPSYAHNCGSNFLAAPDGGGVGFIGNTYSPYGIDDEYQLYYFNQLTQNDIFISGETFASQKNAVAPTSYSFWIRNYYCENFLGDPDLWLFTDLNGALTVTFDNSISTGSQSYTVHVEDKNSADVEGALVCLWKVVSGTDEVYVSDKTDEYGDVDFTINPVTSGTMYLTISTHNFETFEDTITVSSRNSLVRLIAFNTKNTQKGNLISWAIKSEGNVGGFNLYRRNLALTAENNNSKKTALSTLKMSSKYKHTKASKKSNKSYAVDSNEWVKLNDDLITGKNPYHYLDQIKNSDEFEYRLEAIAGDYSIPIYLEKETAEMVQDIKPQTFVYGLKISPNPADDTADLAITVSKSSNAHLKIYDIGGRLVRDFDLPSLTLGENNYSLVVNTLSRGLYILELMCEDGVISKSLLINR